MDEDRATLNYVGIIEARMTSSRLPGKMMKPIGGRPSMQVLIERLQQVSGLHRIVVATTVNPDDDPLNELCDELDVGCFRGSEEDVLGRVLGAARASDADVIVEITGDSTFIDPALTQELIEAYQGSDADFVANCVEVPKVPPGMGARVFATEALAELDRKTQNPDDREHVSLYFWEHPEEYTVLHVAPPPDLAYPDHYIALDGPGDLEMMRHIYDALAAEKPFFTARDIMTYLFAHPEVASLSKRVKRKGAHNDEV